MESNPDKAKTRINKESALLLKSRVALFEGTWLKYFKNTAFVPNGPGWPGKEKDYNANYQYPMAIRQRNQLFPYTGNGGFSGSGRCCCLG